MVCGISICLNTRPYSPLCNASLCTCICVHYVCGFVGVSVVNMFLDRKGNYISMNAVLVTITPLAVSGVEVAWEQFKKKPFGYVGLNHILLF